MIVEIADLGHWGAASLVAEYDPSEDAIRVNVRAVAAIRAALGDVEAERFITVATAHEGFHRDHPGATEAAAHAFARATCDADPAAYERILRSTRQTLP